MPEQQPTAPVPHRATKRKSISASTRWTVFSRDGFMCRYCGARAGQEGVELHVDHVISVVDGGDNSIPNLISACQRCNGGKGARSLAAVPDASEVADRMRERAKSIAQQAKAMREALSQEKALRQQAVNLKCDAYEDTSVRMQAGEEGHIIRLCREFGAETVLEWYRMAHSKRVSEWAAIRYVCGIARNIRKEQEGADPLA